MLKKILIGLLIITLAFVSLTGCGKKNDENTSPGVVDTFSKEDIAKVNEDNTKATINGKQADENMVNAMQNSIKKAPNGLPQGFPAAVPIFEGAEVIDANAFGSDGYSVVYAVTENYKKVVDFYLRGIEGLDDSGVGEEESYFEGIDMGSIHINGLTITDAGDKTQVFITLRDYEKEAEEDDAYVGDSDDTEEITYENAEEVPLSKKYPLDIVPVFPSSKVIDCSMTPSGEGGVVSLVLPSDAYKKAIAYYKEELGLEPENFTSQIMVSETFSGDVKGWKVSVQIAQLKTGNNDPAVSITVNKN